MEWIEAMKAAPQPPHYGLRRGQRGYPRDPARRSRIDRDLQRLDRILLSAKGRGERVDDQRDDIDGGQRQHIGYLRRHDRAPQRRTKGDRQKAETEDRKSGVEGKGV